MLAKVAEAVSAPAAQPSSMRAGMNPSWSVQSPDSSANTDSEIQVLT